MKLINNGQLTIIWYYQKSTGAYNAFSILEKFYFLIFAPTCVKKIFSNKSAPRFSTLWKKSFQKNRFLGQKSPILKQFAFTICRRLPNHFSIELSRPWKAPWNRLISLFSVVYFVLKLFPKKAPKKIHGEILYFRVRRYIVRRKIDFLIKAFIRKL